MFLFIVSKWQNRDFEQWEVLPKVSKGWSWKNGIMDSLIQSYCYYTPVPMQQRWFSVRNPLSETFTFLWKLFRFNMRRIFYVSVNVLIFVSGMFSNWLFWFLSQFSSQVHFIIWVGQPRQYVTKGLLYFFSGWSPSAFIITLPCLVLLIAGHILKMYKVVECMFRRS